jgi:hypothetical protein
MILQHPEIKETEGEGLDKMNLDDNKDIINNNENDKEFSLKFGIIRKNKFIKLKIFRI